MIPKLTEREQAIALRREGFSYREILQKVPVAKSTLSLWLRSVGLSVQQKQRLTAKKLAAALNGARARYDERVKRSLKIQEKAKKEIGVISRRELWFMGIMLHWAEGAKEKVWHPSVGVKFSNSNPQMIKLFLHWLQKFCNITLENIKFEIYLHKTKAESLDNVKKFWAEQLNIPLSQLNTVYWKKNNIMTNRHNKEQSYYGLVTVRVRKSTDLNRKISGWIEGVCRKYNN